MCQMDISIQYDDVFINIMYALKIILNHKTILLLKKIIFLRIVQTDIQCIIIYAMSDFR